MTDEVNNQTNEQAQGESQPQVEQTTNATTEQNTESQVEQNQAETKQPEQPEQPERNDLMNAFTEEQKQEESQQETQQEESKSVIPETYSFKDKEGNVIPTEQTAQYSEVFKKAGLTAEQAQQLFDAYHSANFDFNQKLSAAINEQADTWYKQVLADKELGGQNYNTTKLDIGRAMDRFGTPELRRFLNDSQLGFHPELVRFVAKIGKALGNDHDFVTGKGGTSETPYQRAKRLYPNSPELWGSAE